MRKLNLAILAAFMLGSTAATSWAMQVDVIVNKVSQRMKVMVDGKLKYEWLVSSGGQGYDTLSGNFRIFRKEAEHFSKEWDNAPMPHAMFFTGLGHAIHGTTYVKSLGKRASHGCVRLAPENAQLLFDLIEQAGFQNNTVSIKGGFFEKATLTTADTFKMTPKTKEDVLAAAAKPKSIFSFGKKTEAKPVAEIKKPTAVKSIFSWTSKKPAVKVVEVKVVKQKKKKKKVVKVS